MIKCSMCNNNSIYFNTICNKEYCQKHFSEYFEGSIKKNIQQLTKKAPKLAVYYSGGKDSAVILYVLKKVLKYDVVAITADLGLPQYFEKIADLGNKICNELGIKYYKAQLKHIIGVDIGELIKEKNPRLACHYCGEIRNIALDRASRKLDVDAVVSGHNRDDITRFLLNNYLKNDIFRLMEFASKIYPREDIVKMINYKNPIQLKPLIYLSEKEISLYCSIKNIELTTACCGFGDKNKSDMQGWRNDLTYTINYLEQKYPGYSLDLINNFENNLSTIFNEYIKSNPKVFKERQCVFCKKSMNTEEKDVCLMCKNCAEEIGLKIDEQFSVTLI
ncbi:MAG: ATP-binding protein [Clostridia bacterium]|nr:ATP-binding protein [Clostridia bacterium]